MQGQQYPVSLRRCQRHACCHALHSTATSASSLARAFLWSPSLHRRVIHPPTPTCCLTNHERTLTEKRWNATLSSSEGRRCSTLVVVREFCRYLPPRPVRPGSFASSVRISAQTHTNTPTTLSKPTSLFSQAPFEVSLRTCSRPDYLFNSIGPRRFPP